MPQNIHLRDFSVFLIFKKASIISCLLLCCLLTNATSGQDTIQRIPFPIFHPLDSFLNLSNITTAYVDKSTSLSIENIQVLQSKGAFSPFDSLPFFGRYERGKNHYWLYSSIINRSNETLNLAYLVGKHDSIDIYQIYGNQIKHQQLGYERKIIDHNRIYPNKKSILLTLAPNIEHKIFVKIGQEVRNLRLETILMSEKYEVGEVLKKKYPIIRVHYIFFSILLFLSLFMLLQYFQHREKAFLYYALYVFLFFLHYYRSFEVDSPYLRHLPEWITDYRVSNPLNLLVIFTYLLFVKHFLNTANKFPKLDNTLKKASYFLLAFFLTNRIFLYWDQWLAWRIDNIFQVTFFLFSFYYLLLLFRKKDPLTQYILLGTLVLVAASLTNMVLSISGYDRWGYWDITLLIQYIGIGLELLFFSLGLGYKTRLITLEKNAIEQNLALKQKEKEYQEELNEAKNTFFTNITHEFRTPLTVIEGMADEISAKPENNPKHKAKLIKRNSKRLLNLVNQMLELSKLEHKVISKNLIQDDLVPFLAYLVDSYSSLASAKSISLQFHSEELEIIMDFDQEKIKKIINNLISNAIKFTPQYGNILIIAKEHDSKIQIKVIDTGIGISAEQLPNIFNRFFRADESGHIEGSGIGLAIAKELTVQMGGTISVESTMDNGSTFIIELPITNQAPFQHSTKLQTTTENKSAKAITPTFSPISNNQDDQPIVLIVEDNADLIYYLKNCLSFHYNIIASRNGAAGIDIAFESIPDIIISDIMMPQKDGIELCKTLKEDIRTSHIPIILLTAKSDIESKIQGFETGADAYITKPFSKKELLARLQNLIKQREKLKVKYGNLASMQPSSPINREDQFITQLHELFQKHLDDADFSIPLMCKKMGMGRTQLYRKTKAITGFTLSIYFRKYRLSHAHHLLTTTDKRVSEVGFDCGFENLSWFTQAFKEEYNVTPSEVKKEV